VTDREPLTVHEVAARWRVSDYTVAQMTRTGKLARIPGLGLIRIPVSAVEALEGYDATDDEPDREAQGQAPAPRRGNRRAPQGSVASEAVGGGGPVRGRIGPASGDMAVRRVQG
jgi:hypothetical protein